MTIKILRKAKLSDSILSSTVSTHSVIWIKISSKRPVIFSGYVKIIIQEWQYQ